MFEIQQELAVLSRQMGQLTSHFTDSDRQRAEEAVHVAAIQAAYKSEEERRKEQEIQEWSACMYSLHAVQIVVLEGKSGNTTAAGRLSAAEEKRKSREKLRATFSEKGLVEGLVFGGS